MNTKRVMKNAIWGAGLLLGMLASSGCATLEGEPENLFPAKLVDSTTFIDPTTAFNTLANPGSAGERNRTLRKLLALSDIRYAEFRSGLVADRRHSRAAGSLVTLAADVAATLTESVGVKDNYIALSALIQGGDAIYDEEYLFAKTLDALVAQMDANRKQKLLGIYDAMGRSLDDYPGQVAIADLLEYHRAGSLASALSAIQEKASERSAELDAEIKVLEDKTMPQIALSQSDTGRMSRFVGSLPFAQLAHLGSFLSDHGVSLAAYENESEFRIELKHGLSKLRSDKYPQLGPLVKELEDSGFVVPD